MVILQGLEIALFTLFSIKVLYLFVFSVASRLRVASVVNTVCAGS